MQLRIYNTLTRKLEPFKPVESGKVKIYVCGPTVYSPAHIGHARTYVAFDIIIRFLKYLGYDVFYVRNITDVGHLTEQGEDKILHGAKRERLHPMELVDKYILQFELNMLELGCIRPNIQPRASAHIIDMIEAIKELVEKGYAYESNGNVYYDVAKFAGYGKLSGVKKEELIKHRVEPAPGKRNPADFALWKKAPRDYPLKWPSPFGLGFPGWHIECSVMSMKYLGETLDIHGGARDLIFPHHENEIAQSEALTGKTFVNYWMHTGFLTIRGEKMSKSLGNFITIDELLQKYSAEVFRVFVASSHYRSDIDFSESAMKEAREKLRKLKRALRVAELYARLTDINASEKESSLFLKTIEEIKHKFITAMCNDFNTPQALAELLKLASEIERANENKNVSKAAMEKARDLMLELGEILGLFREFREKEKLHKLIEEIVKLRTLLRKAKDYEKSDLIRAMLHKLGVEVEDQNSESFWYEL